MARTAILLAIGLVVAALALFTGQMASAGPATTQQIVTSALVPAAGGGGAPGYAEAVASCPANSFLVGGGADVDARVAMPITSSGPRSGGHGLAFYGANVGIGNLDEWEATALNFTSIAHNVWATAICEPNTGGNVALTHAYTVGGNATSSELGGQDSCPNGSIAVGGGVDTVDGRSVFVDDSGPVPAATTTAWRADVHSINGTQPFVLGVICAAQASNGLAAPVVLNATQSDTSQSGMTVTSPTCPAGSEATDGGVILDNAGTNQSMSENVPLEGNSPPSLGAGAGTFGPATHWQASWYNGGSSSLTSTVSVICVGPPSASPTTTTTTTTVAPGSKTVVRLAGADRIATAIAVSAQNFANPGTAAAVVLSRDDSFADALAGTPLAVHKAGPLLLTPTASFDPRTQAEIQRVLPGTGTVYVLGGTSAIADSVVTTLQGIGYHVVRLAGANRFATAVQVATSGLNDPSTIVEATGVNFPDALAAGAAAGSISGAVLLTNDTSSAPETAAYLSAHPGDKRFAIGGQAAAADPTATPIVGVDRYETATKVAAAFFTSPNAFGAALGTNFPDALAGGAQIGSVGGPLLLVPAAAPLPASVTSYLQATKPQFGGFLYGGTAAIGDDVKAALLAAVS